jgi:glycosyltransferase domain-containing protein
VKVAVLVPTRNRPDFVGRTIGYYESLKSDHPIYIGDASDGETAAENAKIAARARNTPVRYFHWEGLKAKETTIKLAEIVAAECEFCALQGDDDYYVPTSLSRCAEFLARSPDYRTAQGRGGVVSLDRPGPFGAIQTVHDYWGINSLEQDDGAERLRAFHRKYFIGAYSTHRTRDFVQDSESYADVRDDGFGELLLNYMIAIRGKSKFIDCLYLVRHVPYSRPWDFVKWLVEPDFSAQFQTTVSALARALQETSSLSADEARKAASAVIEGYIDRQITKRSAGLVGGIPSSTRTARVRAADLLPLGAKRAILQTAGRVWRRAVRVSGRQPDTRDLKLLNSPESSFFDEFVPIRESLAGHTVLRAT